MIVEMSMAFVLTLFAGIEGSTQQATWATAMQFVFFSTIPILSFAATTGQIQSRMMGEIGAGIARGDPDVRSQIQRVRQFALRGRLIAPANLILPCVIVSAFPQVLNTLVRGNSEADLGTLKILTPLISLLVLGDSVRYQVYKIYVHHLTGLFRPY